jgi:hypothetical protein
MSGHSSDTGDVFPWPTNGNKSEVRAVIREWQNLGRRPSWAEGDWAAYLYFYHPNEPPQSLWLGSYKTAEEAAVAAVNDAAWHNRNSWGFYFDQERRELVRLGGAAGG